MKPMLLLATLASLAASTSYAVETAHVKPAPLLQLTSTGGVSVSKDGDKIFVDFKQPVAVQDLIKTMARASGKSVVLDRDAAGEKVAVAFPEPLPKQEAYNAIVDALLAKGYQVTDEGAVIRISR